MDSCEIVPDRISRLLRPLRALVGDLSIRRELPQIELAIGDDIDVLVLRVLRPPTAEDEARLRAFAQTHGVQLWLQPKGPDSAFPLHPPTAADLCYRLPEFDLELQFRPTDFTQVNHAINPVLIRRAVALLDPQPGERIGDLFCGLGNFTLPIARLGAVVVGVEGAEAMVARARENAAANGLADRTRFVTANLFEATTESLDLLLPLDKALVDPPREGAVELAKALPHRDDERSLERIVYVSCNPATLARDAAVLVHERGYRLDAAGVVNMFPHTAHVESIALFAR
jgi:23S rRNA (uracil1939-C5)-methyltransferase